MSIWKTLADTIHRSVDRLLTNDELQIEINAVIRRYQHLQGLPVVWSEPSGLSRHGVVKEVTADDELNVWLLAEYQFPAFDDPTRMITTQTRMWVSSFRRLDSRGLDFAVNNVNELPVAA